MHLLYNKNNNIEVQAQLLITAEYYTTQPRGAASHLQHISKYCLAKWCV
jgi:hypothetical protein